MVELGDAELEALSLLDEAHVSGTLECEIREGLTDLTDRSLTISATWLAELLFGMVQSEEPLPNAPTQIRPASPVLLLARSYMDSREYFRAAHVASQGDGSDPRELFLRYYPLYLVGERRKAEEAEETGQKSAVVNRELPALQESLTTLHKDGNLDGYGIWLLAIVERESMQLERARLLLLESLHAAPLHWGAWQALLALCPDGAVVASLLPDLPNHWMRVMFLAAAHLEMHNIQSALALYSQIINFFPTTSYFQGQIAQAHYNNQDFEQAESEFEAMFSADPFRLQQLDVYSNILYAQEATAKLSRLAYTASANNKYSPETCIILGNYFSLQSQHEKAISYFDRALKLAPRMLSAWTLMGHEFVELKSPNAAINAYRRALALSPRDFRAWYGLAQAYEILEMPAYALNYYQRATRLRPYDARMWCAQAECYASMGQRAQAIACYLRAESNVDREGLALAKLASLYRDEGDIERAAYYYKLNLAKKDALGVADQDAVEALLFLARYCRDQGQLEEAEGYCVRLQDHAGKEKEEAKALLRDIHAQLSSTRS